ncbi:MAG: DUF1223 domain-containing protein [Proteobacteria bacterium]|nr:DUF1223 domain-containing protein [Pseudomonadota bacterium]
MSRSLGLVTAASTLCCLALGVSAQERPVVVELFTSQGCSSCPPADAYLGRLSRRSDVLALSFHVDYWDELGWRDRFELPQASTRQSAYVRNMHRSSVYTPQLVVDGREDGFRADDGAIERALKQHRPGVPVKIGVRDAEVQIDVGSSASLGPCNVMLVGYLRHAVSRIGRGENAGRILEEFNIVRDIRRLGLWQGGEQTFRVALQSLPADATDIAVLVQPTSQGSFLGVGTHALR